MFTFDHSEFDRYFRTVGRYGRLDRLAEAAAKGVSIQPYLSRIIEDAVTYGHPEVIQAFRFSHKTLAQLSASAIRHGIAILTIKNFETDVQEDCVREALCLLLQDPPPLSEHEQRLLQNLDLQ